ncbi:MAG: hypothetical protein ACTSYO_06190 [Candidatus Ranarchaeia archaeon]
MNKNIECFMEILRRHGELSTAEIIDYAGQPAFKDLCEGCKSGTDVVAAGRFLEHQGKVSKRIAKGGYIWFLVP